MNRLLSSSLFVLLCCMINISQSFAQATLTRADSCICVNNNAPEGQAQFSERLEVQSAPGELWYISSVSGLYQSTSPVPPAPAIPFQIGVAGDTLVDNGGGTYVLEGILQEQVGYSITLTNGTEELVLQDILCDYPKSVVLGDNSICNGEIQSYTVDLVNPNYSYTWSIGSNGSIVGSATDTVLTVDWKDDATGFSYVTLETTGPTGCSSTNKMRIYFEEWPNLACNGSINVPVSSHCTMNLVADDVLESMIYNNDSYEIFLIDPKTNDTIPDQALASNYLSDSIMYSIVHLCSGNNCWGNVLFEDKYAPPLHCTQDTILCYAGDTPEDVGFPLPDTSLVFKIEDKKYRVEQFDPCGDATLEYTDIVESLSCNHPFSGLVSRTWTLTDFSGTKSYCTQIIRKTRSTVLDVNFPGDWDGVMNPTIACDQQVPLNSEGFPDPSYTGVPTGGLCDHLSLTYNDLKTNICGAEYKVIRKWELHDDCRDTTRYETQLIKIVDKQGPVFDCPKDSDQYAYNMVNCEASVKFPIPANVSDCSNVIFKAEIIALNVYGNETGAKYKMVQENGFFVSHHRALGNHKITLVAQDACNNTTTCSFVATVKDIIAPVAYCNVSNTIALDNKGKAVVPASTFNKDSEDNCGIASIEVKRLDTNCSSNNSFGPSVSFCCADVNEEVTVVLRVTDHAGNAATCQLVMLVQDKQAPEISCPNNVQISCDADYSDLSKFGQVTATDNCEAILSESVDYQINSCGLGTIYRNFTATDKAGNTAQCQQVIHVKNTNALSFGDITWPQDYTTNVCNTYDLDPSELPEQYAKPTFKTKPCSAIAISSTDKVYKNINGSCLSIYRTWLVQDNCSAVSYTKVQKLYVQDDKAPVIKNCADITVETTPAEYCQFKITHKIEAEDACTPSDSLSYAYHIDTNGDGNYDVHGNTANITDLLLPGTHKVKWKVGDYCNNYATCIQYLTVRDKKAPLPYCVSGISTVLMPSTGNLEIEAKTFNLNSTDNCTPADALIYTFTEDNYTKTKLLTCADLNGQDEVIIPLEMYVHDAAGNKDFCAVKIRLQAHNGACDSTQMVTISGQIKTEDGIAMKDVQLDLMDANKQSMQHLSTDAQGEYSFNAVQTGVPLQLQSNYSGEALDGISTLDIVLMQKHILGIEILDSPYKIIAADVDNSQSINGSDIIQLRKLILGHYEQFPKADSWVFVDASQKFSSDLQPWPYNQTVDMFPDSQNLTQDFVSVKIGDLNHSRSMSGLLDQAATRGQQEFVYTWRQQDGRSILDVSMPATACYGFQASFPNLGYPFELVYAHPSMGLTADNFADFDQEVRISWSSAAAVNIDGVLFSLDFGETPGFELSTNPAFSSEIYLDEQGSVDTRNILWRAIDPTPVKGLEVLTNAPNPFSQYTNIAFNLEQSTAVNLSVSDVQGKTLFQATRSFNKGKNIWELSAQDLNLNKNQAVLFYTLSTAKHRITRKMICIH